MSLIYNERMKMKKLIVILAVICVFGFYSMHGADAAVETGSGSGGANLNVPSYVAYMPSDGGSVSALSQGGTIISNAGALNIVINAGATLSSMPDALAAIERGAAQWESRISDPITVTLDFDMGDLGDGGIIGSASSVLLVDSYTTVRNAMVADAADETDDLVTSSLPTISQYGTYLPSGFGLNGGIIGTKANLKALGYTNLDVNHGVSDASITFNTKFSFDYDNSDGVSGGTMDLESIAVHEIGHALGFVSIVDTIDAYLNASATTDQIAPTTLDLFRFDDAENPSNVSEFTTTIRSMVPGNDEITDQVLAWGDLTETEFEMEDGYYTGGGRQASHWKDSLGIGIMDPTFSYGELGFISEADWRAMDLIGYEISPIPEPSQIVMLLGLAAMFWVRRRWRR